jgi:hypothetical protein
MRFIKGDSLKEAIQAFHEGAGTKSPSPLRRRFAFLEAAGKQNGLHAF